MLHRYIKVKHDISFETLSALKPRLLLILADFINYLVDRKVSYVVLASIIREWDKDSVHGYGRGIDVSITNISYILGLEAMNYINDKYQYDKKRPEIRTIIFHRTDRLDDPGWHFHLQSM